MAAGAQYYLGLDQGLMTCGKVWTIPSPKMPRKESSP